MNDGLATPTKRRHVFNVDENIEEIVDVAQQSSPKKRKEVERVFGPDVIVLSSDDEAD